MMVSFWQWGWRSLWRDVRAGELRLLMLAVGLAVAALTAVGFFSDRLQAGLQRDAAQLLGGDVVIASDQPPDERFVEQAHTGGLQTVQTLAFPTMARAPDDKGGESRLVGLKAVGAGYPLRGQLRVADGLDMTDRPAQGMPAASEAWVDASLLSALQLAVGDMLELGDASLRITQILTIEPDRGSGFMSFAPRVLIADSTLPSTGLVQPASRIEYRLALIGDKDAVAGYRQWAQSLLKTEHLRGTRLESLEEGRPEMRRTLDRAQQFLSLVALLAALLCAVAVGLAARSYAQSRLDTAAMLRVLGLPQRTIAGAYIWQFTLAGLAASVLGVFVGWTLHHAFVWMLSGLLQVQLPAASWLPALLGLGLGITLLMAFGIPPVLQLAKVPPLRVLRRELGSIQAGAVAVLGAGLLGFAALLLVVSHDRLVGLIALAGFAVAVALFAFLAGVAVRLLRRAVNEERAPRWLVMATRQVAARPVFAMVQVSSLALGLMALALLVLLRTDLIDSWRQATPADAPNRFVINIQPDQNEAFQAKVREAGVQHMDWNPMIRGRLVSINGQDVETLSYTDARARRLVRREFNLSNSEQAPTHNPITAGQWTAGEADGASVEEGLMQTLGLKLGDRLLFDMAGVHHEARITSVRKVEWGAMRANFFVLFPVAQLEGLAVTYFAAYRAPQVPGFDNDLVRSFPNITNVDMGSTIAQVQRVLDQVIRAVEFLFAFALAAGVVVLMTAVGATREERIHEFAILRAVGASSRLLRQVQRAELIGIGVLAGALAGGAALAIAWALARFAFQFTWSVPWWAPVVSAVAGGLLAWLAGWWSLRAVLQRPVMDTLRRAST